MVVFYSPLSLPDRGGFHVRVISRQADERTRHTGGAGFLASLLIIPRNHRVRGSRKSGA